MVWLALKEGVIKQPFRVEFSSQATDFFRQDSRAGRPRSLSEKEMGEVRELYRGRFSCRGLAKRFGVSRMCIWRALKAGE